MNSNDDSTLRSPTPQTSAGALRARLFAVETQLKQLQTAVISLVEEAEMVAAAQAAAQPISTIAQDSAMLGVRSTAGAENSGERRISGNPINLRKESVPEPLPPEVTEPTRIADVMSGATAPTSIGASYQSVAPEFVSAPAEIQSPVAPTATDRGVLPNSVTTGGFRGFGGGQAYGQSIPPVTANPATGQQLGPKPIPIAAIRQAQQIGDPKSQIVAWFNALMASSHQARRRPSANQVTDDLMNAFSHTVMAVRQSAVGPAGYWEISLDGSEVLVLPPGNEVGESTPYLLSFFDVDRSGPAGCGVQVVLPATINKEHLRYPPIPETVRKGRIILQRA